MIKKGVYAASLSVINSNGTLNVDETISHASETIKNGLHGVFFFGSTGQSQLISSFEKKELIAKVASHKFRKQFFIGTGSNSINENIDLVRYAMEYDFKDFLIMPPAYYKGNTDEGVFEFYSRLITEVPKIKIILYNFEKLSGYKFSAEAVTKLVKKYPENIIGCKDSSYNLFENLKLPNFLMFPGSEAKLLKGLDLGCSGCISAVTNVTHSLARKVFDDFESKKSQTKNEQLINVRETFDQYNLISALHSFLATRDEKFKNVLPPLVLLTTEKQKELIDKLNNLKFISKKNLAA
jgi:4-hydroxy-tetrahydrodipicolinate synthase